MHISERCGKTTEFKPFSQWQLSSEEQEHLSVSLVFVCNCVPSIAKLGFFQYYLLRDTFQCILPVTQLLSTLVNVFSYGYISGLGAQVSAP